MSPKHAESPARAAVRRRDAASRRWRTLNYYPDTPLRMWYLAVAVTATIVLYYELYVTGGVAPLILAHYRMSFIYYVDTLVIANLVGAFGSLLAGLGDRWGRANIVVYGLGATGLLSLVTPLAPDKQTFTVLLVLVSLVEGMVLVATPALVRDFSPQLGRASAMGFWTVGPVVGSIIVSFVANKTLPALHDDWAGQYYIAGLIGLATFTLALFSLRELAPALRDQVMVSLEDREMLEARAMAGTHARITNRWQEALRPEILLPAIGISVFNVIYYTMIGFSTIYLTSIFGFTTHAVNGINTWFWAVNAIALVVVGAASDQLRVRKPFMIAGVVLTVIMTYIFLIQARRPDTDSLTMVLILGQLAIGLALTYVPWMAAFTETVERRNPALMATALAVWGWSVRLSVCVSFFVLPAVVRGMDTLVDAPNLAKTDPARLAAEMAKVQHARSQAPIGWQHWWWICIVAQVLLVALALPLTGRWSPRTAAADLRAHRRRLRVAASAMRLSERVSR